jgi:hypothetical protein
MEYLTELLSIFSSKLSSDDMYVDSCCFVPVAIRLYSGTRVISSTFAWSFKTLISRVVTLFTASLASIVVFDKNEFPKSNDALNFPSASA